MEGSLEMTFVAISGSLHRTLVAVLSSPTHSLQSRHCQSMLSEPPHSKVVPILSSNLFTSFPPTSICNVNVSLGRWEEKERR